MGGIDVIGDIHGRAGELEALLKNMGYEQRAGAYRHPERAVLFLGDLIDRGPQNRRVLHLVRSMEQAGSGRVILGNHEYNALCFHTKDPATGKPLREHNPKNTKQHQAFLEEFATKPDEINPVVDWFRTLPVFLETPTYRAIHACWHAPQIEQLRKKTAGTGVLNFNLILECSRQGSPEYQMLDELLKGLEQPLPAGQCFYDKDNHPRREIRVRWWQHTAQTYREATAMADSVRDQIPEIPFPEGCLPGYPLDAVPVFFGHYWFTGEPVLQGPNAACLDYSVGNPGGALCCYRYDDEPYLSKANFVRVVRTD